MRSTSSLKKLVDDLVKTVSVYSTENNNKKKLVSY